jgi:hypothetical protein
MVRPKRSKSASVQEDIDCVDLTPEAIRGIQSSVFLYKGRPVITLRQMDELHGHSAGEAGHAFRRHRRKMALGKHYAIVKIADLKGVLSPLETVNLTVSKGDKGGYKGHIILLYRRGYLLLVKSFSDDLAWQVQEALVDAFERLEAGELVQATQPALLPPAWIQEIQQVIASEIARHSQEIEARPLPAAWVQEIKQTVASAMAAEAQGMEYRLWVDAINGRHNLRFFIQQELKKTLQQPAPAPQQAPIFQPARPNRGNPAQTRATSPAWARMTDAVWLDRGDKPGRASDFVALAPAGLFPADSLRGQALQFAAAAACCEGAEFKVQDGALTVRLRRGPGAIGSPRLYWLELER